MNSINVVCYNKHNSADYIKLLEIYKLELDIYYQPDFLEIDAAIQKGSYEVFTAKIGNDIFIYPYIKLPFGEKFKEYTDITSPYGYCGPYCSNQSLLTDFENAFISHAGNNNFVSEFIRYHFLYNADFKFQNNIQNIQNRFIIALDLSKKSDEIWMNEMSSTNRNIVRKLEKEGYTVEISTEINHLEEFIDMYHKTMMNVNATEFYYFDKEIYFSFLEKLKGKIFIARVCKDKITFASALFFLSGKILTYYLSARNLLYPNIPSSNLLLTNIAKFGQSQQCNWFNLGGGRTNSKDDALFKFKANFSKNVINFYIGKRIHSSEIYKKITDEYIQENGNERFLEMRSVLQFYRA